jgi:type IV pilus assembly protein PilB
MGELDEDVEFAPTTRRTTTPRPRASLGDAPVVKLCNVILLNAIKKGASDIHIEPYEKSSASATGSTACCTRR